MAKVKEDHVINKPLEAGILIAVMAVLILSTWIVTMTACGMTKQDIRQEMSVAVSNSIAINMQATAKATSSAVVKNLIDQNVSIQINVAPISYIEPASGRMRTLSPAITNIAAADMGKFIYSLDPFNIIYSKIIYGESKNIIIYFTNNTITTGYRCMNKKRLNPD